MGYKPSLFWDISLQEVFDLIESHNRVRDIKLKEYKEELKEKVILNSVLARQVGEYVAILFSDKAKITKLSELFPKLFEEETVKTDMSVYKAKMESFMYRHNSNRRKEE